MICSCLFKYRIMFVLTAYPVYTMGGVVVVGLSLHI